MQNIVETLCALSGVKYAGIYQNGDTLGSNFPDTQQRAMSQSNQVVSQMFFALESVQKSHNELYFGIDGGYLAAFRLHRGYTALLLTDRKINIPMLSMAIKSATETIRHHEETVRTTPSIPAEGMPDQQTDTGLPESVPLDESLRPVFEQYTQILMRYLGPAARVVVDDAIDQWKQTYVQTPNNLTYLVATLTEEIESDKERQEFAAKAAGVTVPAM